MPNVESRFGWTATKVEQDAGSARVTITRDGASEVLEGDYLVGCDGGHSIVREQIGIPRSGHDFDQLMVLIVLRSRELHDELGKRFPPKSIYRAMHPDLNGYWKFFGRIDVGEGFFFHAPVPKDTTRDNFDFMGLLHEATGFPFKAEFDHVGFWDLRVAVAEKYQVGRVFIAGDAAHSHPPYGGFGLNNGLEDAVNLGWKLAAKLDGWGGDTLLQSYSDERRPIFKEVAEDFIAARIRNDGAFLNRYNPARDKAEFETAWKGQESDVGNRAQVYEPSYEGSPVVIGPPGGVSTAHGKHVFKARAGHHLVPQKLIVRPRRVRGTGARLHAAGVRCGRRGGAGVRAGGARVEGAAEGRARQLCRWPHEIRDADDPGPAGSVHRLDRRQRAGGCRADHAQGGRAGLVHGRMQAHRDDQDGEAEDARLRGMPQDRKRVVSSSRLPDLRSCRMLRPVARPHATKHFHATKHPIIEGYDPPEGWGWCYVDEIMIDLGDDTTPQVGPIPRYY